MINYLIAYVFGIFCVSNFLVIWKLTNISNHIYNFLIFFKKNGEKIFTPEDLEDHLILKCGWWGELLTCPLCLTTHLSWIVALLIALLFNLSFLFVLSAMFSWPIFAFAIYSLLKKI